MYERHLYREQPSGFDPLGLFGSGAFETGKVLTLSETGKEYWND